MKLHLKCSVHSLQFLDKSAALIRWFMLRIWIGSNLKDSRLQTFYPFWINETREKHSKVHWKLAVYMHELQGTVGFSKHPYRNEIAFEVQRSLEFSDKSAALIRWFMWRIWIESNLQDSPPQTFYPFSINEAREKHCEVHCPLTVHMHALQRTVGFLSIFIVMKLHLKCSTYYSFFIKVQR